MHWVDSAASTTRFGAPHLMQNTSRLAFAIGAAGRAGARFLPGRDVELEIAAAGAAIGRDCADRLVLRGVTMRAAGFPLVRLFHARPRANSLSLRNDGHLAPEDGLPTGRSARGGLP